MQIPLIHPMLVHFPIAFYFLEFLLISLWILKRDEHFRHFALFTFWAAFFSMIAALIAGWIDTGGWDGVQGKVVEHFYGAAVLTGIQLLRAGYWQFGKPQSRKAMWICFAGSLLGCAAVVYTGLHGGEIVYGTD